MTFTDAQRQAAERLIALALAEDWQDAGDLTCNAVIPPELIGEAVFVSRSAGVAAGLPVAPLIYRHARGEAVFEPLLEDGARLQKGTALARVHGSMAAILSTERVVLNFLQRLSGVASLTRKYVDLVADLPVQVLDTR